MKHANWFILTLLIALIAVPAFAQDDDGGGALGGGGFDNDSPGDEGGGFSTGPSVPAVDPLVDLRNWLAKASAPPIEKKQEKSLKSIYDKQVKLMADSFQKQFGIPLQTALAAQAPGRGRRGGAARPTNAAHSAEILRLSTLVMDKVIAGLRIDQQAALRKYQSEELRVKEVRLLKERLTAAGIILSEEQHSQVDEVYARKSRLRTLAIIEAKGAPYDRTIAILERQTTQRVVQLLDQSQKAVLSAGVSKPKAP